MASLARCENDCGPGLRMEEADDIELGPTIRKPLTSLLKAVENDDKEAVYQWLQWLKENPEEEGMLNDGDALGNTIAHLAAKLDRDEILKMLLSSKMGIDVNICNSDALTPLHLACIKGHVNIVNLILHYAPVDSKERILSTKDGHSNGPLQLAIFYGHENVTLAILKDNKEFINVPDDQQGSPLHLAAKYDLVNIIEYLLESGADIESTDAQLHTPLMVAILSGHVNASLKLIEKGARIEGVDCDGRNIVHLAAEQDLVTVLEIVDSTFFRNACKAYDSTRDTPLHIAAAKGSLAIMDLIVKENISIDSKNNHEKTPLHVAAECGNTRIMQRFLSYRKVALNNQDINGCTPLHLACQQGHSAVAEMLVKVGARIHFKNDRQRTPLVCAIRAGSNEIVKLLIEAGAGTDVDHGEEDILSLAMMKGAGVDIAFTLLAGGLISKTTNLCEPIKKIPALAKELLNQCIKGRTVNDNLQKVHTEKKDCLFMLDFEPIEGFTSDNFTKESHPLSLMVEHKRLELLKHPVVNSLIKYKWKKYGQFLYLFNLTFYAIFLIFLTSFALVVVNPSHSTCVQAFNSIQNINIPLTCQGLSPSRSQFIIGAAFVIVFLVSIRIIIEIFQFMRHKLRYFKEVINWLEIVLYFSTLNFVWIFHSPCFCVTERQWELGVVAVFLGWFILTLFTDKLPLAGLYVLMFISILKTFLKTIVLSLLLIVSFGLAFFMLFRNPNISRSPFASPFIAMLKTMTMSEGEFDFDENFAVDRGGTTPSIAYPITSFFLWLIFLILMSILLTNLLTGLAVDDVKGIRDNATLKRLKLKIDFLLAIDGFTHQFQDFIPKIIYEWLTTENKITVLVYNKLSAWQKLQLSLLERDHDLLVSAQEFISVTEDSAARWMKQCSEKRDLNLKMAELQEDTERIQVSQEKVRNQLKKTINDLEAKVTKLSNDNEDMKKCLSDLSQQNFELKQTILELSNYNHWQKDIISEIAKKLSVSSEHPSISD